MRDEDNAEDRDERLKKRPGRPGPWFIELCLTHSSLDVATRAKWRQLSMDKQEASSYRAVAAFLQQFFYAVIPKSVIKKQSDLIEGLSLSIALASLDS